MNSADKNLMSPSKMDDHYIANADNAHLDLSEFRSDLRTLIAKEREIGIDDAGISNRIYSKVLSLCEKEIVQPGDENLVCRYLNPLKFQWFCALKSLHFSNPLGFDDPKECTVAEDYDNEIICALTNEFVNPTVWESCSAEKAREWLISCWTKLDHHYDDNLLWYKYADGPNGAGITVRYGALKSILEAKVPAQAIDQRMFSGFVDYGTRICLPCFSKRKIF